MRWMRASAWLLALAVFSLGLALPGTAQAATPAAGPLAPAKAGGYAEGTLAGSSGGGFVLYSFAYPGDGSTVTLKLDLSTADIDVLRSTGLNVYGPTADKVYASTATTGPGPSRSVVLTSTEPGTYLVQLFNYSSTAVPFALTSDQVALTSGEPASAQPAVPGGRTIVLDPGHGGPEIGAVSPEGDLLEKAINLKIALKLADLLRADGHQVILTRDADRPVTPNYRSGNISPDLQARIDIANAAGADLFISIHNNGGPRSQSGTEVWYNKARPFADRNLALAQLVQANLLQQIRGLGYPVRDRGVKHDTYFRVIRGQAYNIYVLGPGTGPRKHVPTQMPAVLGESLFMSHPGDAAMLRQERTLDAIATGYRDAIRAYFQKYPD